VAGLAPIVGAGVLMLGGLAAAELGVRLGEGGAVAVYVVLALGGLAAALLDVKRRPEPPEGERLP
jgi:hypothetical protein